MRANYYNEFDPFAAAWLRELIKHGHIPFGVVDERSIEDLTPADLAGYTQCHFFAGIGGWSLALRLADWPEDRPVWTGSCPCQPFSTAGKGDGFADERHLWPSWLHLIRQCRPPVVFGEQVEAAINHQWLDLVQGDLEGEGYNFGAVGIPAACVEAPHIRQRLWFVADTGLSQRTGRDIAPQGQQPRHGDARGEPAPCGTSGILADRICIRWDARGNDDPQHDRGVIDSGCFSDILADSKLQQRQDRQPGVGAEHDTSGRDEGAAATAGLCDLGILADTPQRGQRIDGSAPGSTGHAAQCVAVDPLALPGGEGYQEQCRGRNEPKGSPASGFWSDCDWLPCRDGKWRPVEPGTFPLAHGVSNRVGRLRGYGNAIVPQVAAEVIKAYMTC